MNQPHSKSGSHIAETAATHDPFAQFADREVQRVVPTTEAQREIWLADRLSDEASLSYNESASLYFDGPLDDAALAAALWALGERHEALRSTIGADGTELWVTAGEPLQARVLNVSTLAAEEREATLRAERAKAVETRFDLEHGPLVRAVLMRRDKTQHELMLTAHHIVCDGWSLGVLTADLMSLYRSFACGQSSTLEPAPRFSDYALEQHQAPALAQQTQDERFWVKLYDRSVPTLDLPLDRARPSNRRTFTSRREDLLIDAELTTAIKRFGAAQGSSLFATLFGLYAALLARLSGSDDVVVGVPAAGQASAGQTGLVGHCVNLLPMRVGVNLEQTASGHVAQARTVVLDAYEHQSCTFGSLLKKLQIERDPTRLPLVSVVFNLDAAIDAQALSDAQLQVRVVGNPRHAENFELFLNVAQIEGGLRLECQYQTELFDAATIRRWLTLYRTVLKRCTQQPEIKLAHALQPTEEEQALLASFNNTARPYDRGQRIETLIAAQAAATPDAVAVVARATHLSYGELNTRANALALDLQQRGVGPGDLVGLCCGRNEHMLVALLGILKSGAGYLPLDPSLPPQRLEFMAHDAGLRFIATETSVTNANGEWPFTAAQPVAVDQLTPTPTAPTTHATPQDVAYVIYTSGSTGMPKGVRVPHRSVVNLLTSLQHVPGIQATHRVLSVTTLSFDIAVSETILPLTVGARVVIADRSQSTDGDQLRHLIEQENIDFIDATPSTWRLLLAAGWTGHTDLRAICTGEPLPPDLAATLLPMVGELWNGYGPTETTVWSSFHRIDRVTGRIPIGKPIANTQIHVVDDQLRPLPLGAIGELYIAGEGVTLGYLNRPELNAERFLPAPPDMPAGPWYRTGDLGRWRADGVLECLGRIDHQVKVRGYRIELGEIEATLARHPEVKRAVVITREDEPEDVRIVAYIVPRSAAFDALALRKHLASTLPEYMIAQHFVRLDSLPLLANGKLDRRSLPRPTQATAQNLLPSGEYAAPRNECERQVLSEMESVLNLPGLGVHDNFFTLGGHSLLAMRLTTRLNAVFKTRLPLRSVFESPTAEALASAIDSAQQRGASARTPIHHDANQNSAPMTVMQERVRFMEELHPGRVLFNTPSGHRLSGSLDRAKFEQALQTIVQRQPALRTRIALGDDGHSHQQIIEDHITFTLPFEDFTTRPLAQRADTMMQHMQAIIDTPIPIYSTPLFRCALYKLAENEHGFLFMPHHIIWDGWSFDVLYQELAAIYGALVEERPITLPPPSITYADFARWQAEWLQGPECAREVQYWKTRFAAAPLPKMPTTDMPRGIGMSGNGATEWVHFDSELIERLRAVGRRHDLTLSMLMMSVYAAMMAAAIDTGSVVVGLPMRGRLSPETEGVMGFFNNMLPVQFIVDPTRSFADYLRSVKRDTLDVFEHQEIPFERLASEPEISTRLQRFGLYQTLFSFQDARDRKREWGTLRQQSILVFQKGATEDLGVWMMEVPGGVDGGFTYNTDIYLPETAAALHEHYEELLRRVANDPNLTLGELTAIEGSPSAQRLRRLAGHGETPNRTNAPMPVAIPTPPAQATAPTATASTSEAILCVTDNERTLAKVWADLLAIDIQQIAPRDNFFDLGGNSLLAMRAVESSGRALGFRIDARRYFYENLAQLANEQAVGTAAAAPPADQPRGLIQRVFGSLSSFLGGGKNRKS